MKIKNIKSKSTLLVLCLLYMMIFQIVYLNWISDIFAYQGYANNPYWGGLIVAVPLLVVLVFSAKNGNQPSSIFQWLSITLIFVPSSVIYVGQGIGVEFVATTFFAVFLLITVSNIAKLKTIRNPAVSNKIIVNTLVLMTVMTLLGIIFYSGLTYLNFDFSKIYDFRREAAEAIPGFFGYLNSNVSKVAIPFGIAIAYRERRWGAVGILVVGAILLYGLTSHKSVIFYPALIFLILFLLRSQKFNSLFLWLLIATVVVSGFDLWLYSNGYQAGISGWFGSLFAVRGMLVPSTLNAIYVDYFSGAEKYYWATSKISLGLITSPYDLGAPNLIGDVYFGNSGMSANTGWIGSGFANAGYFGIVIYSIIFGLLLSILDAYAEKIDSNLVTAMFFAVVITFFTSADFTDMLLTNGLLFALVILIFMNGENVENRMKQRV